MNDTSPPTPPPSPPPSPQTSSPAKRGRQRRLVILSAFVAGISFALGTIVAQTLPKMRSWLLVSIDRISQQHLPVRIIPGTVDFRIFPLGASFYDIKILPKPDAPFQLSPMQIEEVSADLSFLAIVSGEVALSHVRVAGTSFEFGMNDRPSSGGPPLEGLFHALEAVPIDELEIENVSARIRLPQGGWQLSLDQLQLNSQRTRRKLQVEANLDSLLINRAATRASPEFSLRLSPRVNFTLTPERIEIDQVQIQRGATELELQGELVGDTETLRFKNGRLELNAQVDVKSINDWLIKNQRWAAKNPPMSGKLKIKTKGVLKASGKASGGGGANEPQWTAQTEISTEAYVVEGLFLDRLRGLGQWDGRVLHFPVVTLESPAKKLEFANLKIGAAPTSVASAPAVTGPATSTPAPAAANAAAPKSAGSKAAENNADPKVILQIGRMSGQLKLHEFFALSPSLGRIPVWTTAAVDAPCEAELTPNFLLRCGGQLRLSDIVIRDDLKLGPQPQGAIVAIPRFDLQGETSFDLDQMRFKALMSMPNSKGTAQGEVGYLTGFDIKYEAEKFDFKDLASLSGLKLEGALQKVRGKTTGDSKAAEFSFQAEGQDLWFEDFWLGSPSAEVSYKSGILNFLNMQGYLSTSRYSGDIKVDLDQSRISVAARFPFFDAKDLLKALSRKAQIPIQVTGTGQANIRATGPMALGKLTYDLKSSLFKGSVAGESFDVFHFDLKSKDGEVRTERVSLKHGEAEITLTGQGHPNGEIETKVRGREIRLENTNTIANSGFGLSGLLNFEMDLTGPVLAPDALMRARLTKTAIAEASMPDSAFDLRFARNRIEGSGQLLGDVLAGEFVWPFEVDAPLVLKLRANDWNFAPIFAAIAGPASRKDFEAELSGVVDLQAPRGGLWASTGKIDLSRIRLSRGPISIANVDPIRAQIRDGVFDVQSFELKGDETFVKIENRPGTTREAKLDIDVQTKIDLSLFSILTPFFEELRGLLSSKVSIKAGPDRGDIIGTAYVERGFIKFPAFPHPFENIRTDVNFNHRSMQINSIKSDFASGRLSGAGEVVFKGPRDLPVNVVGSFDRISLNVPQDIRTVGSGDFSFTGNWFPFLLKGNYEIYNGLFSMEMSGGKTAAEVRARREQYLPKFLREDSTSPINVDLKIETKAGLPLKTSQIEGLASAKLHVAGDPTKPIIRGEVRTLPETKVIFQKNVFEVTNAVLDFQGTEEINPLLNVQARTRVAEYDVALLVQGTAQKPEIQFQSVPPLPEKDLIALLAVGTTQEGTAGASNLGQAAITGVINPITGGIGRQFGLDVQLSHGCDENNECAPKVTAAKRINQRLSVSGTRSFGKRQETDAKLNYRLTDRVSVVGSWQGNEFNEQAEQGGQNARNQDRLGLDFEYKFEFK
ncbi:MAG TPA: translocation/assembly module TamB domain-containing protein [Pseudobdellovibrionaceae bacterium]|nr:translocation/assembly module TamB domain-containing protein [Pseudobdellovibrionaceae bacterium]